MRIQWLMENLFLKAFGVEISRFPRLAIWYKTCKKTFPSFDECEAGAQMIVEFLGNKLTKGF